MGVVHQELIPLSQGFVQVGGNLMVHVNFLLSFFNLLVSFFVKLIVLRSQERGLLEQDLVLLGEQMAPLFQIKDLFV